ncbi:hypothetical protein D3C85_1300750 [compost metagenome]
MKKVIRLFEWISRKWKSFLRYISRHVKDAEVATKFKIEFVEDTPDRISENTIFVVQDGNFPEHLAFECPCGCRARIILNLLPDASPKWSYIIDEKGKIDIYPSIWRKVGCKSHFFVRESNIDWA